MKGGRGAETPRPCREMRYLLIASGGTDEVFINLGKNDMRTLDGFHWGFVSTMQASGGIGLKTQQMKAWLERIQTEKGIKRV